MYTVYMSQEIKLDRTYKGLSKLLLEFNLDFNDVLNTLREYYVRETYKHSKTITRTSLKSGIDRRTVSAIINDKKQYHKPSSIFTILSEIKLLANKNNDLLVNKRGVNSIESLIKEIAHGSTTLNSVINELVELGCILDEGDKVKFVTNYIGKTPNKQRSIEILSNHIYRYINTITYNLNCKEDEKQFEYSIYSTKISPSRKQDLDNEIRSTLEKTTIEVRQILEKYEENSHGVSYEETGVSLTQFNLNKEEN